MSESILFLIIGLIAGAVIVVLSFFVSRVGQSSKSQSVENTLKDRIKELTSSIKEKDNELGIKIQEISDLKAKNAVLEEANSKHNDELANAKKELNSAFKEMATSILKENTKTFSDSSEKGLGDILNPLREQIADFKKKVEESYAKEHDEKINLKNEINNIVITSNKLSADAQNLTSALKGNHKMQGNWGEMQLEQILQMAGLEKGVHYQTQQQFTNDDGKTSIPDVVVNLPDEKNYVIDSKVSLVAYERYFNSETEDECKQAWAEHMQNLRNHIDGLSKKSYQNLYGINAPDYVFLFMPIESALTQALQDDPSLYNYALGKNIVLVSSTLLLATLRTVSFIWKQDLQRKYVDQITYEGGKLYDAFVDLLDELRRVGEAIKNSENAYQKAVNKLNDSSKFGGTIIGRVQRLQKMGAKSTKKIDPKVIQSLGLDEGE